MKLWQWGLSGILAAVVPFLADEVRADVLGTFSWQFAPFCNVVTVTIVQDGDGLSLSGSDDNCGAAKRSPAFGSATSASTPPR